MASLKDKIKEYAPFFVDIWQYIAIIVVMILGLIFIL
jgi:hypothetical protein